MSNAKKKAAPKKATDEKKPLTQAEKAAKFKTIATRRTKQAVKFISNLGNLSNKSSYDFTPAQVDKIYQTLTDAIVESKKKFDAKEKKKAADFSLDESAE